MVKPVSAADVMDREYLPTRAKILEVAASLDRVARTAGDGENDPRWHQLHSALEAVLELDSGRAERVQMIFSREYQENWRNELDVAQ